MRIPVSFSIQATSINNVTRILSQIESGDPSAAEKLLPLVYEELRKLAAVRMAQERSDHTLQATALVHEAYLRLVDVDEVQKWDSRGHFFSAAAEAMRRILVDAVRQRKRMKRGGDLRRVPFDDECAALNNDEDLFAINAALDQLAAADAQAAQLVKLRFFAGLRMDEAALAMGISVRNAYYLWDYARSWLRVDLADD